MVTEKKNMGSNKSRRYFLNNSPVPVFTVVSDTFLFSSERSVRAIHLIHYYRLNQMNVCIIVVDYFKPSGDGMGGFFLCGQLFVLSKVVPCFQSKSVKRENQNFYRHTSVKVYINFNIRQLQRVLASRYPQCSCV